MPPAWIQKCVCLGTGRALLTHGAAEVLYRFRIYKERIRIAKKKRRSAASCDTQRVPDGDAG